MRRVVRPALRGKISASELLYARDCAQRGLVQSGGHLLNYGRRDEPVEQGCARAGAKGKLARLVAGAGAGADVLEAREKLADAALGAAARHKAREQGVHVRRVRDVRGAPSGVQAGPFGAQAMEVGVVRLFLCRHCAREERGKLK